MKKHFIFDFDETLVDGRNFCANVIAMTVRKFDKSIPVDEVFELHNSFEGSTIFDHYTRVIEKYNLKQTLEELMAIDKEMQLGGLEHMQLFDGALKALDYLKDNNISMYICTNRKMETLQPMLKFNQIDNYFKDIVSCVDKGFKKPDPTTLEELISKHKLNKKEIVYVGDSQIDEDFATNAGVDHFIFDQYKTSNEFMFDEVKKLVG